VKSGKLSVCLDNGGSHILEVRIREVLLYYVYENKPYQQDYHQGHHYKSMYSLLVRPES